MAKILTTQQHILEKRTKVIHKGIQQSFTDGLVILANEPEEFCSYKLFGSSWKERLAVWMANDPKILAAMLESVSMAINMGAGIPTEVDGVEDADGAEKPPLSPEQLETPAPKSNLILPASMTEPEPKEDTDGDEGN